MSIASSMTVLAKDQRMRDPVHGVIAFSGSDSFEQLIWKLINTSEFQRLRRIKQLGFSELVYPGATHTRFSHSIGVFHTARELVGRLRILSGDEFEQDKANIAICAALLHDIGHGPFSHAFEACEKAREQPKKHEKWTSEIILESAEIEKVFSDYSEIPDMKRKVADLLGLDYPEDIYSSIVSSQFDADRLDYLRRDKMMTGTEQGGFDWNWLMHNIEVADVFSTGRESRIPILILGSKGLKAAEGYLLGRFHLYSQVYMHKTTRGAEKLLETLLTHLAKMIRDGCGTKTGLQPDHPASLYLADQGGTLENFLLLDDAVIWGCLSQIERGEDQTAANLAGRLRSRNLYKCLDIGALGRNANEDAQARFKYELKKRNLSPPKILQDEDNISAYKFQDHETSGELEKILIRKNDGSGNYVDAARESTIVNAIGSEKFYRVYGESDEVMNELNDIWNNVK